MLIKKRAEKTLFFSLWALLIVGIGIYSFWNNDHVVGEDPLPAVILGDELKSWFQSASVTRMSATTYTIEIQLQDKYAAEMRGDRRRMHLAYHFMRGTSALSQGVAEVNIDPRGPIKLVLANPNRVDARSIQLLLSH